MAKEPERGKKLEHEQEESSGSRNDPNTHEEHGHQHGGMGMRGVTRPMEEMKHHGHGGHHHEMSDDDKHHMLVMHHKQTLWIYWTLVILGFWVLFSPLTFSYAKATVDPSGGREIWLTLAQRVEFMTWSDIIAGLLLIVFGWRSLTPNRPISLWVCCFIGVWLTFAPLIFWAPTGASYLNATIVGAWVIALSILIPGMPNMILFMKMGGNQPPGWSYNPSSWPQRWILICLAFAGWITSRYLAAFQMGYIDHAWDPFFGESTRQVLNSNMSHMWPVSDGGFGAAAYTFEFLMGFMGATSRWRTMPWMVLFFGILVIPLGLVHIFLVISQPVIVGHWCTLCLLAAGLMLPMIPLSVDEVIAMGQHMLDSKRKGHGLWQTFWKGGPAEGSTMDERSPDLIDLPQKPGAVVGAALWGMTFPWRLVLATLAGLWLMFTPAALGVAETASHLFHLGGALVVVTSVIAMGEPLRAGRYFNLLLALIVAGGVWFLPGANLLAQINGIVVALVIAALSIPRGPKTETYGRWDRFIA
jgi:hypothetical protein